jgi:hypothetical protein
MRKAQLFLVVTLFFLVIIFSSTQASVQDRGPCVRRCNEELRDARQRCKQLQGEERRRCLHAAQERHRVCVHACRN